jgi:uncharacterized protein
MSRHQILDPALGRQVTRDRCALGIMTKAPQAGKVKTRLTPPLTPAEAAELNACFLRDLGRSIFQASVQSPAQGVGVYTPPGSDSVYRDILPDEFLLIPQRGQSFGERLAFATEDLFKVGFTAVCLINSDSPTVPASSFVEAVNELAKPGDRIVLGPSEDGGYYLIGVKRVNRQVFEEIAWSTDQVLAQTRQRAADANTEVHLLPPGFDVDDSNALKRLCQELLTDESGTAERAAASTRKFLKRFVEREDLERIWQM